MSPPDTNIHTQKRRHRGPLVGITLVVILVAIGFFWWVGTEVTAPAPAVEEEPLSPPVIETEPQMEELPVPPTTPTDG